MAEEAKTGEDENLNSEGQEGDEGKTPEATDKTTYTKEEVDAMMKKKQSDSEKWVQKLIDEGKFKDAVIDATAKVNVDKQYLVTLSETEPKVAKAILDKYYDGITIEEFMEEEGLEMDLSDPEIVKKRIASEARRIANEEKISEKRDAFIEEFKMTKEEKEQFEVEFAERVALKSFDMKDIRKHLEKAYREIDSDSEGRKKLEQQETIGKALATGSGKDSATPNTNNAMSKAREEAKAFHKKFNI